MYYQSQNNGALAALLAQETEVPDSVRDLLQAAYATNTRRAYQSDLRAFRKWGGDVPTTPQEIARYIAEEGRRLHPSTLQRRLSALSSAHALAGGTDQPCHHPLVKAVFSGLRRQRGVAQSQAAPLTLDLLRAILDTMGETIRDQRDRALLLICFAGGLRRSELVGLDRRDLDFTPEGIVLTLRRGKTDQEGRGRLVAIPNGSDRCCPVRAVSQWLKVAEIDTGPLFRAIRKGGTVAPNRLSGDAVSILVKRHIERIGLDPTHYSGHSLRAGFVTTAARAGIASHAIRQQTGHASDATMSRYIREGSLFRGNAAGQLL